MPSAASKASNDCKRQSEQSNFINTIDRHQDLRHKRPSSALDGQPSSDEAGDTTKRVRLTNSTAESEGQNHPDIPRVISTTESQNVLEETPLDEDQEIARRRAIRAEILARHKLTPDGTSPNDSILLSAATSARPSPDCESPMASTSDITRRTATMNDATASDEEQIAAADFDPDADRIAEHEMRRAHHQDRDIETTTSETFSAVPADKTQQDAAQGADDSDDDMFADPITVTKAKVTPADSESKGKGARKLDEGMLESWADTDGYYRIMIGELLDGRYAVQSILGKGVFSAVVKAIDQNSGEGVAIKVIRNNALMRKAALKEIAILEDLMRADPEDRKHIVRLRRTFEHRGHLCLVFECFSLNLREVLKKFGRDVGINIKAVRAYAQQIFLGLSLMQTCNVMHADLKPDNILVSESRTMLKICDLGSASDISENALTPYLASRFYRAPEVILGLPYDAAMDVWAIGCTLYEMFTGKILFPGRSNNQMLRLIMELKGKVPQKLLRKAAFCSNHFDELLNFNSMEVDKITQEPILRVLTFSKPVRDLKARLLGTSGPEERTLIVLFVDLLERCLELDSSKRISPVEALKHPFLARTK